jgi:hypothetical protein
VLPPPFDLGHFCHQKAQFIAIKFRYRCNAVNISDEIVSLTQERLELGFTIASTEDVTV